MSLSRRDKMQCPRCGKEFSIEIFDTINAKFSPAARELLLQGKVNSYVCPTCDLRIIINRPLLYHDMTNKYLTFFVPPFFADDVNFLDKLDEKGRYVVLPNNTISVDYFNDTHIVFSMEELVNYIRFREKHAARKAQQYSDVKDQA
jgi:hypothetical protein